MTLSRRSFVSDVSAAGLFSLLAAHPELGQAVRQAHSAVQPTQSTEGQKYWSKLYSPERGGKLPKEDRDTRFVHYSASKGMRWAEDLSAEELPGFTEDAVVTIDLNGFRAGTLDGQRMAKVNYGQMHLSCQQVTGTDFVGPLAWAALATIFSKNVKNLPNLKDVSVNPGQQSTPGAPQLNRVLLNQGVGKLSVNVTTTPVTSTFDKVLGVLITGTKVLTPLLGFPAISLPALQAFYSLYGTLEKAMPENFLFNSALKNVAVTQQGAASHISAAHPMCLVSGDYLLIPKVHEEEFSKNLDKVTVQNGYLVAKDAPSSMPPDERIKQAIPDISYVTLNVRVQSASSAKSSSIAPAG